MLVAGSSLVSRVGSFVAPARDAFEDYRERTTMPRLGLVRIRSVDRHAVMSDRVTRLKRNSDFAIEIIRCVINNTL